MSTADRIERERLAKRTLILDAARDLFVERGIEAVTLREIAQRIEYSTTAIYVQFKDKQDLVEQMVREDFGKFANALQRAASVPDAVDRLEKLGHEYINFALTMPRHYQLLFMTPMRKPVAPAHVDADSPDEGIAGYHLLLHTVEEIMTAGRFRAELTDAQALAQIIWAGVHGLVSVMIVAGHVAEFAWRPHDELTSIWFDSMMRGMLRSERGHERVTQRTSTVSSNKAKPSPAAERAARKPPRSSKTPKSR